MNNRTTDVARCSEMSVHTVHASEFCYSFMPLTTLYTCYIQDTNVEGNCIL